MSKKGKRAARSKRPAPETKTTPEDFSSDNSENAGKINAGHATAKQRLNERVEKVVDDDRRWFASNPSRSHRLRRADPTEIAQFEVTLGKSLTPKAGEAHYIGVRQIVPGLRHRLVIIAELGMDCRVPEEDAKFIIECNAPPPGSRWAKLQEDLREACRGRSTGGRA